MLPQTHRQKAEYSLSKFSIDGFSVDFYTNIKTKDGKARVMLTVMAIFDVASEAITGYSVGIVEDGLMARNAIRNHLNIWDGKWYFEAESDGGSAFFNKETKEILEKLSLYRTRSISKDLTGKVSANPKARRAERYLQEVNRMASRMLGWKGTNITSYDPRRKPNDDYTSCTEGIGNGVQQVIQLIEAYNNQKIEKYGNKSRLEHFRNNMHPQAQVFGVVDRAMLLNQWTKKQLEGDLIEITVNRKKYQYQLENYDSYLHLLGKKRELKVCFDETDMSSIHVFGFVKDEPYLCECFPMPTAQEAKIEQTQKDLKVIGKRHQVLEKVQKNTRRKALEVVAAAHELYIPANATVEEAEELVKGAKIQSIRTFEERYSEEIEPNTISNYYRDRLIYAENERTDAPKTDIESKRDFYKKRFG
jgi:hypothetical protein